MNALHVVLLAAILLAIGVVILRRRAVRGVLLELNTLRQRVYQVSAPALVGQIQKVALGFDQASGALRRDASTVSQVRVHLRSLRRELRRLEHEQAHFEAAITSRNALQQWLGRLSSHPKGSDLEQLFCGADLTLGAVNELVETGRFVEAHGLASSEAERVAQAFQATIQQQDQLRTLLPSVRSQMKEALAGNAPVLVSAEWAQVVAQDRKVKEWVKDGKSAQALELATDIHSHLKGIVSELARSLRHQLKSTRAAATAALSNLHAWPLGLEAQAEQVQRLQAAIEGLQTEGGALPSALHALLVRAQAVADEASRLTTRHLEGWDVYMHGVRAQFQHEPDLPSAHEELPEDMAAELATLQTRRQDLGMELESTPGWEVAKEALELLEQETRMRQRSSSLSDTLEEELETLHRSVMVLRKLPAEAGLSAEQIEAFETRMIELKSLLARNALGQAREDMDDFETDVLSLTEEGRLRCYEAAHDQLEIMRKVLQTLHSQGLAALVRRDARRLERDVGMLQQAVDRKELVDALLVANQWTERTEKVLETAWRKRLEPRLNAARGTLAVLKRALNGSAMSEARQERLVSLEHAVDDLEARLKRRELDGLSQGLAELEGALSEDRTGDGA